jgi:dTDP-4-amino-4,6-dideoxygalactose transaminase
VIRAKDKKNRDGLKEYLKANGVGVNFHYPAVYSHPYYQENGFRDFELKNEEEYQGSCITLPCFPGLKKSEVKYVARLIKNFLLK